MYTGLVYSASMKNITFSADDELIERARRKATRERTTLNERFRGWLARYVGKTEKAGYRALMKSLKHVKAGRRFSRDEANER